jgi:hypothetical protein
MLLWLESQSTAVIVLLVFAICYALGAIVFFAVKTISRRPIAEQLNATTPVMLTPLAVIAGLLIAFLASRVWSNLDRATTYVAQEASAIRQSVLLSDALPDDTRTAVRTALKQYLRFIETDDWPAMAQDRANLRRIPAGLPDAMKALLSFSPAAPEQQLAQERAVIAIEQALEARRYRIVLSQATISPIQWLVIFLLDTLILLTIAFVHLNRPATAVVNLVIFSTAVACCLVLLMVHDRPLRSRWDHATAACVARCRSRLTLILDRIKRCCWRCNAVDLRGAPHQHTDAPDLARQLIELIAPVPPPRQSVACPAALQRKAPPRRGLELGDQRLQYSSLVRLFYGRSRSRLHVAQNENPATLFLRGGVSAAPSGVCW